MESSQHEVAVIGGGIGGLIVGYGLYKEGYDVHIYEQAPAYADVGGHLTMDSPTVEVLARWCLDEPFAEISCKLDGMEVRGIDDGNVAAYFQFPSLGALGVDDTKDTGIRVLAAFLRPDFLDMVTSRMPKERLHTGHKLVALKSGEDYATAEFENGETVQASVILGADGVRSIARSMLDEAETHAAGHTILRTLCSADVLPEGYPNDRMRFWDGWKFGDKENLVGFHALTVPVREGRYVSVDLQFIGGDQLEDCNWSDVPIERVEARYPETMDPVIKAMVDARLEPITTHTLYDRRVATNWVDGRIAVLGDAAHSMRPNLGQGACQSIHDAGQLVDSIKEFGLSNEALKHYEAIRKPYVESIVETAKNTTPDPKKWKDKGQGAA
ncbi:MAG: NAD(P)/FAD-dependent oxidoreductase [Halieaceae bacterium]|nr:NAD(P)/FAD-dependent oxidoreductase [Halieaceae bacterium]